MMLPGPPVQEHAMTLRHPAAFAVFALGCAAVAPPAAADAPPRTSEACGIASLCSSNTALDLSRKGWRVHGLAPDRPARYACDQNGFNCRYTRDYYISDDGNAQYRPGGGAPVESDD
jgi:hypothetical protein